MSFIAGSYTATYGGYALGQVESGFNLEPTLEGEPIVGNTLGRTTVQDGVYTGGNYFLSFTLVEFNATAVLYLMNPFQTTPASDWGKVGIVGGLWSAFSRAIVLTKINGPNSSPTSLTSSYAILAEGFPTPLLFDGALRRVPMRLRFLPYTSGGSVVWFTTT